MKNATIYTVTPNPALDLSGIVQEIRPNEKNYVFDERRDPGGNGINASRVITRLSRFAAFRSVKTLALGFLGGCSGQEISDRLRIEKVAHAFTPIQGSTRANMTISNRKTHQQTRIAFHGPLVSTAEIKSLLRKTQKTCKKPGVLILGGSLPLGCPDAIYRKIAAIAHRNGLGVVMDVPAPLLKNIADFKFKPLLLKPNQAELEGWIGHALKSDAELKRAAQKLARHCSLCVVSLAERGALFATKNQVFFARAPHIRARGTVGAGDSMLAGMVSVLASVGVTTPETFETLERENPETFEALLYECSRWGMACGAATAESVGTALAEPREILRLAKRTRPW